MRTALVRYSPDLTTKAPGTRKRFSARLVDNLRAALRAEGQPFELRWNLARIELHYERADALETVSRIFGVHSLSPAWTLPLQSPGELLARIAERAAPRVEGRRFAVRARVRDRRFAMGGQRVNEMLGALLVERGGRVDLTSPEVTVHVEVRDGRAWVYDRSLPGPGGLPLGVGGRAVVLLSGGFDSAVAAWRLMRRGIRPELLGMRLGGEPHERALREVAEVLARRWAPGLPMRLTIVPFEEVAERIRAESPPRLWQLVLKRAMYAVAERLARRRRCDALVTGEALGQVSSQTLRNLRALEAGCSLPVLRPLLTEDKERIVAEARHIGTEAISAKVPEYCGLGGRRPATGAGTREVLEAEERLGLDAGTLLAAGRLHELGATPDPDAPRAAERPAATTPLDIAHPPDGALLVDLRRPALRRREPLPEDWAVVAPDDPSRWLEDYAGQDARAANHRPVVVLCEAGSRSAWLASALRERGVEAYRWSPSEPSAAPAAPGEETSATGGGP